MFSNNDFKNIDIFGEIEDALKIAEQKHPVFAEGVAQAIGRLSEELGEIAQAVNHGEPENRIMSEALDLLVVAWRFYRRDWEVK